MTDKQTELLNDVKGQCGCYKQGSSYYDKLGNLTHEEGEECNQ